MLDYIKGEITQLSPTHVVLENAGLGYFINISLPIYSYLSDKQSCKLYVYEAIREDAHILYGFLDTTERQLFLHLLSVSGVGASTARMIMSSLTVAEIQEVIATSNVQILKSVKGIGLKTAERIIVDLKGKVLKSESESSALFVVDNAIQKEAVSALVMLGFNQQASQKVVEKILKETPSLKVEQLIKIALKMI
ncbi:MAG: Holliday junction branch migration protein RuvA [Paludibacteraceae bacterium]|nr:Holliday junction branch migration protein RuvA [Paludibacteraceae bacterium]